MNTRSMYEILGCLDRGIYVDAPELYGAHLAWLIRTYDRLASAGRDNLGVACYYVTNRLTTHCSEGKV